VPANDQLIVQVPAAKVLTVAQVKMPPVLSVVATDKTEQVAGVLLTADNKCPILKRPEFCPLVKSNEEIKL
jgi:hypothetical protein